MRCRRRFFVFSASRRGWVQSQSRLRNWRCGVCVRCRQPHSQIQRPKNGETEANRKWRRTHSSQLASQPTDQPRCRVDSNPWSRGCILVVTNTSLRATKTPEVTAVRMARPTAASSYLHEATQCATRGRRHSAARESLSLRTFHARRTVKKTREGHAHSIGGQKCTCAPFRRLCCVDGAEPFDQGQANDVFRAAAQTR